jgi:hypothetical protein
MSAVHQLPVQRQEGSAPPADICRQCRGAGYVPQHIWNWQRGESQWVGDTACTACGGSGREIEAATPFDASDSIATFRRNYAAAGAVITADQNRQLQLAAMIDQGEELPGMYAGWWRDQAARAFTRLRFVDRDLGRHYGLAAKTGNAPNPAVLPLEEEREIWAERFAHCDWLCYQAEKAQP